MNSRNYMTKVKKRPSLYSRRKQLARSQMSISESSKPKCITSISRLKRKMRENLLNKVLISLEATISS